MAERSTHVMLRANMGKSMPVTIAVVVDATVVGSYTTSTVRGGQGRGTGQSISEMSVAHILLHTTVCVYRMTGQYFLHNYHLTPFINIAGNKVSDYESLKRLNLNSKVHT